MKKILTIIWFLFLILGIVVIVDEIHTDNANKTAWEQRHIDYNQCKAQKQQNYQDILDSLTNVWISNTDTSLQKVEKTIKTPHTHCSGYWKKTGRFECEQRYNGKLLCSPESTYVETNNCTVYYTKDTVWSSGWRTREDWITFTKNEAKNNIENAIAELCNSEVPYFEKGKYPYTSIGAMVIDKFNLNEIKTGLQFLGGSVLSLILVCYFGFIICYPIILLNLWFKR